MRVDDVETRLAVVEHSLADSRDENRRGFDDIKMQLNHIYAERTEWGKWAREHLGVFFKWLGIIVLAACGINQADKIIQSIAESVAKFTGRIIAQ